MRNAKRIVIVIMIRLLVAAKNFNQLFLENALITPPSGRGLVIPFFSVVFFLGGHLPQTSGFRSAKEILVLSFATQPRAFILSDRNIFYTPRGGEQRRGLMPLGLFLFLVYFFRGHLPQTLGFRSAK